MKYRTLAQFEEICENMLNGNWADAASSCVKFGFFANDLKNAQNKTEFPIISDVWSFAILAEMATELRSSDDKN